VSTHCAGRLCPCNARSCVSGRWQRSGADEGARNFVGGRGDEVTISGDGRVIGSVNVSACAHAHADRHVRA
jgi:hypothetical protein